VATNTYEIVSKGGLRWDQVSQLAYGNPFQFEDIVRANPSLSEFDIIPDGMVIIIPINDNIEIETDDTSLPPWKR